VYICLLEQSRSDKAYRTQTCRLPLIFSSLHGGWRRHFATNPISGNFIPCSFPDRSLFRLVSRTWPLPPKHSVVSVSTPGATAVSVSVRNRNAVVIPLQTPLFRMRIFEQRLITSFPLRQEKEQFVDAVLPIL
jgi:hypothetical protein